jgi:hypothetical protein
MNWHNLINPAEREHIARLEMRLIQVTAKSTTESNEVIEVIQISLKKNVIKNNNYQ